MRAERFELPTFWSGVRRATVAPYPRWNCTSHTALIRESRRAEKRPSLHQRIVRSNYQLWFYVFTIHIRYKHNSFANLCFPYIFSHMRISYPNSDTIHRRASKQDCRFLPAAERSYENHTLYFRQRTSQILVDTATEDFFTYLCFSFFFPWDTLHMISFV